MKSVVVMDNSPYEIDVRRWKHGKRYYGAAKRVDVVDDETGEVVDVALSSTYKPCYIDGTRFVKVYDPSVLTRLSRTGVGVFAYVMSVLGYGSEVTVDARRCMEMNGWTSTRSVYNGLNELFALDVLRRNRERRGAYFVNPNVLYRGDRRRIANKEVKTEL